MSNIHATAVVHPTAKLHPSVVVGPYAIIGEDVEIGEGSTVGAHAIVEFAKIGKNNRLFHGCFVGTAPQDLKYKGERTLLEMGDNNTVREMAQLNRGTDASGKTVIGSNCLFCAFTHVAHDCRIGDHVIMVSFAALAGHVELGDYAVLSAHVGIHQYVRIGKMVMVSAGAAVGKDVPPFCIAQGDRAKLRGLNVVGLRRSKLPREVVKAVREAYRTLFLSGQPMEAALAALKGSKIELIQYLAQFIETAKKGRGITMPPPPGAQQEEEIAA
ncbi:MAG: acyl-ACP--UDP-N-acetylglucosamine O-acyltransferase [Elusimicrobiota bacterium]